MARSRMPILDVEVVLPPGEKLPEGMSAAIAEAAAVVFRTPPGQTWVRLHELSQGHYSENGGGPDPELQPVFVRVIKAAVSRESELQAEVLALTTAIAQVCTRRVENVHVLYDPPAAGRIAFGGRVLKGGDGA
jgi:phenylpyruvate tautomerase PptA (4-oxalocrotonate tautomerase family)